MRLIRCHQTLPLPLQQAVITIGNFDGVHLGHQALLTTLKAQATRLGCACGVILFEPQPAEFFLSDPPARLSTFAQKYHAIKQQGIDFIMVLRFNNKLARLSAPDFITRILWQQLHAREIWVGEDFRFGWQRQGDFALLNQQGPACGFTVHCLPDVQRDQVRVSSTQIRALLAAGKLADAAQLLGHDFTLEGKVIPGAARGRTLQIRTANIRPRYKLPLQGIFVVSVQWQGQSWSAVASVGTRPVYAGQEVLVEVHLFDFDQDLYGQRLQITFLHKLRDEAYFDSVELLQAQMQQDMINAKKYWNLNA